MAVDGPTAAGLGVDSEEERATRRTRTAALAAPMTSATRVRRTRARRDSPFVTTPATVVDTGSGAGGGTVDMDAKSRAAARASGDSFVRSSGSCSSIPASASPRAFARASLMAFALGQRLPLSKARARSITAAMACGTCGAMLASCGAGINPRRTIISADVALS